MKMCKHYSVFLPFNVPIRLKFSRWTQVRKKSWAGEIWGKYLIRAKTLHIFTVSVLGTVEVKIWNHVPNFTLTSKWRVWLKEPWAQGSDGEMAKRLEEIFQPDQVSKVQRFPALCLQTLRSALIHDLSNAGSHNLSFCFDLRIQRLAWSYEAF